MPTRIAWCDETLNVTAGCFRTSPGCDKCWAERFAKRLQGMGLPLYQGVVDKNGWTGKINVDLNVLKKLDHWRKPRRIFIDSMADLFALNQGSRLPMVFYTALFWKLANRPQHTFTILTKRPLSAAEIMNDVHNDFEKRWKGEYIWPIQNVWFGVSVESQDWVERIPDMLNRIPAALHFASLEPLLGEVDITPYLRPDGKRPGLDWIVTGCETGPGRRPAQYEWFRSLQSQCEQAGVPFYLKALEIDGKIAHLISIDGKYVRQEP